MHRFFDRAGSPTARANAASDVAFAHFNDVGTPKHTLSRLKSPAYACPCQCFAGALTNTDA
jgi:hypothetical protein